MAAILRPAGKFLRIVSGRIVSGQNSSDPPTSIGTDGGPLISSTTTTNAGSMPYHAWSLNHLRNALPVLTSLEKSKQECEDIIKPMERRKSDPLLEFYVGKQKIEQATKNIKAIENRVGLNVIKELKQDVETKNIVEKVEVAVIENEHVVVTPEAKQEVKEEMVEVKEIKEEPQRVERLEVITEEPEAELEHLEVEVISEVTEDADMIIAQQGAVQPELVPICEDPASHQWFPLPVVCQMFRAQGRIYELEGLLWGSQGIRPEDRKCIYYWTLQAYADCGMFPEAVDLTRRLETEMLAMDFPEYHSLMNSFAMAVYHQNQGSFVSSSSQASSIHDSSPTPVSSLDEVEVETRQVESQLVEVDPAIFHRQLKKAIASKDIKSCVINFRGLQRYGGKELNITESSSLIELLVKDEYLEEAIEVTEKMLVREAYPLPRIFRFLLNRLASKGEVEAMHTIGSYLTPKIKKEVSFDNRLCNAYLAAGRAEDYLNLLIAELDQALAANDLDEENLQLLKDKFPRGGAMGLLESNSSLVEPYTKLALKFVQLGYVAPVNVLWTYHFINGRHDLAQPLWNQYVRTCPQIMFQKVCQTARSTSNTDLAERLVVLLENAVVTNGARGIAYSCLLDVLTKNNDFEKGLKSLKQGLHSGIKLDDVNRTALKRLKEGLQQQGRDFPYEIPKKTDFDDDTKSLTPI